MSVFKKSIGKGKIINDINDIIQLFKLNKLDDLYYANISNINNIQLIKLDIVGISYNNYFWNIIVRDNSVIGISIFSFNINNIESIILDNIKIKILTYNNFQNIQFSKNLVFNKCSNKSICDTINNLFNINNKYIAYN